MRNIKVLKTGTEKELVVEVIIDFLGPTNGRIDVVINNLIIIYLNYLNN